MKEPKVFVKWDDQVKKLEERNIKYSNKNERKNARYALQNNSYYALVNGYKDIFCITNGENEDDYQGELFINLRDAHDFDKELSSLLFKFLLRIEDSLKSIFSYHVGKKWGHKESSYLEESNYRQGRFITKSNLYERDILINKLQSIAVKNEDPQLVHYRKEYGYVPPWVLVGCISLDTLMYWYKLSRAEIKKNTLETMLYNYEHYPFDHITDYEESAELFSNIMMIIKEYRNRAAHGNRIMNHISQHNIKINLLELYATNRKDVMLIYNEGNGVLNRDLLSLLVSITIMLSKRNTVRNNFLNELDQLFEKLRLDNNYLYSKIMNEIKLPLNFIEILKGIV